MIRLMSSEILIGMTGWILSTHCALSPGPVGNVKLFWNGRLIMSATGFCAALASCSVVGPPPVVAVGEVAVVPPSEVAPSVVVVVASYRARIPAAK